MKIAIVGSAPATCDLAPFDDPSWDMWTLAWRDAKRTNRMFEMHDPSKWEFHGGPDYRARLAKSQTIIYMLALDPCIPASYAYPENVVLDDLAPPGQECDFFTSSLSYMLALAIHMRPAEIGLFGTDMNAEEEYAYQRPAMTYLVGLARGRSIKVTVPEPSPLLKAHFRYGRYTGTDHAFPQARGITRDFLDTRVARYAGDRTVAEARMNEGLAIIKGIDGALGEAKSLLAAPELTREAIEADVVRLESDRAKVAERVNDHIAQMNTVDGALGEAKALREAVNHFNRGGVIA